MATGEAAKAPKEGVDAGDWGGSFKAQTLDAFHLHGAASGRQQQRWYRR